MINDLLAPTTIPDWHPDLGILTTFQPEVDNPVLVQEPGTSVAQPSEPPAVDAIEANGLKVAEDLIASSESIPIKYSQDLLQDALNAQPILLSLVIGEIKRQTLQIEAVSRALSKLPNKNLLSAFRLTQLLTLDRVVSEAQKYLEKQKSKIENTKSKKALTDEVPSKPYAVNAVTELIRLSYQSKLSKTTEPSSLYFSEESILLAAKHELLAQRMITFYTAGVNANYSSELLDIAYTGLEKSVLDSTEMLSELIAYAAQDQVSTLSRLKSLNELYQLSALLTGLETDYREVIASNYDTTGFELTADDLNSLG